MTTLHCSDCGEPLTDLYYGYTDCGPHTREDFEKVRGYKIDAPEQMGNWDDGPSWLFVPLDKLPEVSTFYMTKERCCGRVDIELADESHYCRMCRDVMDATEEMK